MYVEQEISKCIEKFSKDLNIPSEMLTLNECGNNNCNHTMSKAYWLNIYKTGQGQDVHCHTNLDDDHRLSNSQVMFSFTYFAKYDPEKDAKFVFVNPSPAPDIFHDWVEMVPEGDQRITVSGNFHKKIETKCKCDTTFSGNLYRTTDKKKST
jgi:hypothetical protein